MKFMMDEMPILYSFRRCPYAMRARMALIAADVAYEHREVVLRDKPRALVDASPKATVPVLVTGGGKVIDESLDIMRWALDINDPEDWLRRADPALVAAFDGAFKHHLDRYKYANRHDGDPLAHRSEGLEMIASLEPRLAGHGYLCGAARGHADIAIFPFIRQFAWVEPDWFAGAAPARVQQWLAELVSSRLFEEAMRRHPTWTDAAS